jgi:AraC-like DNA-binding protein
MDTQFHHQRIKKLYQMLFEMATGNLTFRIQQSDHSDELDELAKLLNALASEMQEVILNIGFVNPHYSYQNLVQTSFILSPEFRIKSFNADAAITLGYNYEKLFQMEFGEILAAQSIDIWNKITIEAAEDENFHTTIQLIFSTNDKKLVPSFCTISRLLYSNTILVSCISTILQDLILNLAPSVNRDAKQSDAIVIQNVYEYILNHLEEPLPTLKELSVLFKTNEFKLKDGFRHFFKTSIYSFYNEERLKRAHLMIQQTKIPLKEIAFMNGFNTYLNFYKAFKKRYKYPPSEIQRDAD